MNAVLNLSLKEKVVEREMMRVEKRRRRQGARAGPEVVMEVRKTRICERKWRFLNISVNDDHTMIYLNCRMGNMGTGKTHTPHICCKRRNVL